MQIKRNPCYLLGVHGVGFDSACEGGYGGRYGETLQRTDARDPETEGDERDDQNTKGVRPQTRAPSERASEQRLAWLGYGTPRRPSGPALAPPIASRRPSCPRSGLLSLAPPALAVAAAAIHNSALRRCVVPCCPHWCSSCICNCNPWEGEWEEILEESGSVVGDGYLWGGQQHIKCVAQCRGKGGCGVACVRHSISEPHPTA